MHQALYEHTISNLSELLIYTMTGTKGLGKVLKKLLSYLC